MKAFCLLVFASALGTPTSTEANTEVICTDNCNARGLLAFDLHEKITESIDGEVGTEKSIAEQAAILFKIRIILPLLKGTTGHFILPKELVQALSNLESLVLGASLLAVPSAITINLDINMPNGLDTIISVDYGKSRENMTLHNFLTNGITIPASKYLEMYHAQRKQNLHTYSTKNFEFRIDTTKAFLTLLMPDKIENHKREKGEIRISDKYATRPTPPTTAPFQQSPLALVVETLMPAT